MAIQYRLRIVRGDRQFEAEGDEAFVRKMAERFEGDLNAPTPDVKKKGSGKSEPPTGDAGRTGKEISVREFIQKLALKKHTDLVLAFGYYLEHNLAKAAFTPADINNLYYEAKLETSNTSQAIIQNIKRSLMMEQKNGGGGRKSYTLTQSGDRFIAEKLAEPSAD
jgi:hypothetical protein